MKTPNYDTGIYVQPDHVIKADKILSDAVPKSLMALLNLVQHPGQPAEVRVMAAKTILDYSKSK